jgi:hypothetical protein
MKKNRPGPDILLKRYKRCFFILLTFFVLFMFSIGVFLYLNYDYLAFKYFISEHYIYTEALDTLFSQELKRDVQNKYYSYFDNVAISLFTKSIREINNDNYTYLYLPEKYRQKKEEEKQEALQSYIEELTGETVYLKLTNFSVHSLGFVKDNIHKMENYRNIIIDLRGNLGGDIKVMQKICDLFLPKGDIIAVDKMRFMDWTYKSEKHPVLQYENIVILQDGNTASSSENMITALNDNLENVILVGTKTYGKGIGQYTLPLRKGFAVKATILKWYTPNGQNIQDTGIEPERPYQGEDPASYALYLLESGALGRDNN